MLPALREEGKLCHQVTKKGKKHSFAALHSQNQVTIFAINSVIPSATTADFPLNHFNNCR
ncbi:MAG TPA: hypothetical protein DEO70_09175 [Bacteroidales bacterium]|nr:MAG: hypothetical protein A2X11_11705 [Bacteroidetes bacterium GWE2_42_24]OFY28267.1 MAG: hypothetical protein A2X09_11985 [Bacteroidetes bacterium GWF2_43_11]HBZ66997.1 hypothetical protein [Bacteroidales bacterium]